MVGVAQWAPIVFQLPVLLFLSAMNTLRPAGLAGLMLVSRVAACGLVFGLGAAFAAPAFASPADAPQQLARANGTQIHLDLRARRISVIRNGERRGPWPVAIGDPKTPTPSGMFKVENMRINPQYQSTKSGKVNPVTGPGGPLGHRWIGFLRQGDNQFGIHGTPWPHWVKIRAAVSNGCVRMLNDHVQELYELVDVGTPVVITR